MPTLKEFIAARRNPAQADRSNSNVSPSSSSSSWSSGFQVGSPMSSSCASGSCSPVSLSSRCASADFLNNYNSLTPTSLGSVSSASDMGQFHDLSALGSRMNSNSYNYRSSGRGLLNPSSNNRKGPPPVRKGSMPLCAIPSDEELQLEAGSTTSNISNNNTRCESMASSANLQPASHPSSMKLTTGLSPNITPSDPRTGSSHAKFSSPDGLGLGHYSISSSAPDLSYGSRSTTSSVHHRIPKKMANRYSESHPDAALWRHWDADESYRQAIFHQSQKIERVSLLRPGPMPTTPYSPPSSGMNQSLSAAMVPLISHSLPNLQESLSSKMEQLPSSSQTYQGRDAAAIEVSTSIAPSTPTGNLSKRHSTATIPPVQAQVVGSRSSSSVLNSKGSPSHPPCNPVVMSPASGDGIPSNPTIPLTHSIDSSDVASTAIFFSDGDGRPLNQASNIKMLQHVLRQPDASNSLYDSISSATIDSSDHSNPGRAAEDNTATLNHEAPVTVIAARSVRLLHPKSGPKCIVLSLSQLSMI